MKRLLAITLAMVMALALFAGCAAPAATEAPAAEAPAAEAPAAEAPAAEAPAAEAPAAEAPAAEEPALKVFHTYMSDDVPMLNGHDTVEGSLNTVHDYCSAPLYKKIPSDSLRGWDYIGVCASELPIQIDEHNWQIKIREEACWQNGDPINADTFMYSYKMLLDPILANQMANFLADYQITIVNAPEYMLQGTANTVAWEDVGIKKVDDYTIQITTVGVHTAEQVASNFLDRSVYPVYEPLYEAGMNADRTETTYGTTLDMWMGAGAYYFDQWEYDNIHVYKKNPNFWQADLYNYDQVEVRIVPEMNARVELFEQGLLDSFTPDANTIDAYIDDPRVSTYKDLTVYHIDVNCKNPNNPISGNVNYRKALYHAIDREVVAEDLFGHMEPTGTYISWAAGQQGGDGTRYRETEYGLATTALVESWGPYGYNPELALEYFNKACEEEGVGPDEVIKILFTCEDTSAAYAAMGEFFQQEWPKIFDGRVEVEIVTYAGMSATAFKKTGDDKWDLSPNDWTSGTTRTYPHACFMYYLESYGSHPNNYFDKKFEEMFAELDVMKNEGAPYEEILKKTQALEEHYLDVVIHIPIVQDVAYDIFNDKLILPVDEYVPSFGWGTPFGDFEE